MKTIIEMAREAGLGGFLEPHWDLRQELECFAALVRADEREKFCAHLRHFHDVYALSSNPGQLRERGDE